MLQGENGRLTISLYTLPDCLAGDTMQQLESGSGPQEPQAEGDSQLPELNPHETTVAVPANHNILYIAGGEMQQLDPGSQEPQAEGDSQPPELNPDGSEKKKRRQHTRWKEEEVMRLLQGVESLGVGHWRQM